MRYYIPDTNEVLVAESAEDLVITLWRLARVYDKNYALYMRNAARRIRVQYSLNVRYDSAENFVADLLASGLIREA